MSAGTDLSTSQDLHLFLHKIAGPDGEIGIAAWIERLCVKHHLTHLFQITNLIHTMIP